ncbi:MAG: hypothetical protein Q9227_003517 [Pyrenula ochraceoflavens]
MDMDLNLGSSSHQEKQNQADEILWKDIDAMLCSQDAVHCTIPDAGANPNQDTHYSVQAQLENHAARAYDTPVKLSDSAIDELLNEDGFAVSTEVTNVLGRPPNPNNCSFSSSLPSTSVRPRADEISCSYDFHGGYSNGQNPLTQTSLTGSNTQTVQNLFKDASSGAKPINLIQMGKDTLNNTLDSAAAHVCLTWLMTYPDMPKEDHFKALGFLTNYPASTIESWFGAKLRSNSPSTQDSGYLTGTGTSHLPFTHDSLSPLSQEQSHSVDFQNSRIYSLDEQPPPNIDGLMRILTPPNRSGPLLSHGKDVISNEIVVASLEEPLEPKISCNTRKAALVRAERRVQSHLKKGCVPTTNKGLLRRDPKKPFQCTFKCGKSFARKDDLRRHEEAKYPQRGWVCPVEEVASFSGQCQHGHCSHVNPPHDHSERTDERQRHVARGDEIRCGRYHYRREHFQQHFTRVHPHLRWQDYEKEARFEVRSKLPKYCGFCVRRFASWTWRGRLDHMCDHFKRDGCDMSRWISSTKRIRRETERFRHDHPDNDEGDDDSDDDDSNDSNDNYNNGNQEPDNNSGDNEESSDRRGHDEAVSLGGLPEPGTHGCIDMTSDMSKKILQEIIHQVLKLWKNLRLRCSTGRSLNNDADSLPNPNPFEIEMSSLHSRLQSLWDLSEGDCLIQQFEGIAWQITQMLTNIIQLLAPLLTQLSQLQAMLPRKSPLRYSLKRNLTNFRFLGAALRSHKIVPHDSILGDDGQNTDIEGDTERLQLPSVNPDTLSSLRLLGRGRFGVVDAVKDNTSGSVYARKTWTKPEHDRDHFTNELRALLKLRHPHIVRMVGLYTHGPSRSMLFSDVADMNLSELMEASPPMSQQTSIMWDQFGCLSDALHHIHYGHSRGWSTQINFGASGWHGDLKPQNILVFLSACSKDRLTLKLADFGSSRFQSTGPTPVEKRESRQKSTARCGTRAYRPPETSEQRETSDRMSRAADIFSLGCVFLEYTTWMLTGSISEFRTHQKVHFEGDKSYCENLTKTYEWLDNLCGQASSSEVSKINIIRAMLSRKPFKRPNARQLCEALSFGDCCTLGRQISEGENYSSCLYSLLEILRRKNAHTFRESRHKLRLEKIKQRVADRIIRRRNVCQKSEAQSYEGLTVPSDVNAEDGLESDERYSAPHSEAQAQSENYTVQTGDFYS